MEAPDDRSQLAIAYHWAFRIMTVSLEMVLPGVFGHWLDLKLGIRGVFASLGFVGGFVLGMTHLVRMKSPGERSEGPATRENPKQ